MTINLLDNWNMHGWGMHGWWWILLIALFVFIFFNNYRKSNPKEPSNKESEAMELLKKRYAKGEINAEEYRKMRDTLQE